MGEEYSYDVTAKPKSEKIEIANKEYSVLKLWKDGGSISRPKSVTVDILKDGIVVDTVVLNSKNNWKYSFKTNEIASEWSVVERNVPAGYSVSISEKEASFVIVNSLNVPNKPSTNVPQTGDNSPIELYIIIFCISGLMIIILGIGMRRKENAA